jgi:hypothetical protein
MTRRTQGTLGTSDGGVGEEEEGAHGSKIDLANVHDGYPGVLRTPLFARGWDRHFDWLQRGAILRRARSPMHRPLLVDSANCIVVVMPFFDARHNKTDSNSE